MGSQTRRQSPRKEALAQIAMGIARASGGEFFPLLVHQLARGLGAACALVGRLRDPSDGLLTAVTADVRGKLQVDLSYPLEETPFADVIAGAPFVYPERTGELFPRDAFITEKGFESCAAAPLRGSGGRIVGVLAVMRDAADPDPEHTLEVIEFFAPRAAAEIERSLTEEALGLTQFAIDHSADASFWMGPDGRFTYVNEAACRSLGYSAEELKSMSVPDIDPLYNAEFWPSAWERVRNERTYTFESLHRRKDGTDFPVEIRVNYLEFAGREYNCAFATDITKRRRAEALVSGQSMVLELIASGAPLEETLLELTRVVEAQSPGAQCLLCLLDETGNCISPAAGPSVAESFKQAVMQTPVQEGLGACATAAHRKELVVVEDVMTDPLFEHHRELMSSHGLRACWAAPILSSAGKALGTFALLYRECKRPGQEELALIETASHLARIAIERRQSEESLRLLGERFRHLIERMPEGVLVHRFGPVVYANPKAALALGYERPEELIGLSVIDMVEPGQRKRLRARIQEMYETRKPSPPGELRITRKDGRSSIAELESIPIEFDGEPAVVSIARDVTERKRMQARLLQADRMASVGTLAAGVAHEINNPLAYVISNLDYLAREMPSMIKELSEKDARTAGGNGAGDIRAHLDDLEETVLEAREGAERVRQIVQDLRTFSRDAEDDLSPVEIQGILESSINMARRQIERHGRIVLELDPVPPVLASESRLGQVFLNLLLNAAQALPEDRADRNEVRVRTRRGEGGRVIVEIEDTGVGIPPDNLDQIFQPFFTTKPVGVGTGLGLSICQNIVSALGGEISVWSSPGRGTTFRLQLPVSPAPTANGTGLPTRG